MRGDRPEPGLRGFVKALRSTTGFRWRMSMLLFCSASLAYSKGIGTAALVVGGVSAVALPFSYWYLHRYGYDRWSRKLG